MTNDRFEKCAFNWYHKRRDVRVKTTQIAKPSIQQGEKIGKITNKQFIKKEMK